MSIQVAVQTENLRKEFSAGLGRARMVALHGLTLRVEVGEVFGVLGPNGSGGQPLPVSQQRVQQ